VRPDGTIKKEDEHDVFIEETLFACYFFGSDQKKTMFFLNRRMSSAKASPFSSGFILFSEHEILLLLANKTQKVRGKKNVLCAGTSPQILKKS
jgi:hypothetical protein